MSDRNVTIGPAWLLGSVAFLLGVLRRSRRLLLIGVGVLAIEAVPQYRGWLSAKAAKLREQAEERMAVAEAADESTTE